MAQLNKTDQDVKRLKPLAEQRAVPQQDYDNALAAQQAAKADVEGKQAALNTAKVNQTAAIQQAQAAVEAANASIRQAELNVEYCTITSPIDGIAGTRQVAPGNLVGQGEATLLTTVSNVNPMRVFVSISEREYLMYQRMRAEGKLKGGGGELELILADGSTFPAEGAHHHRRPRGGPEDRHPEHRCRVPQSEGPAAAGAVRPCPAGGDGGGKRSAGAAEGRHGNAERQGRLRRRRRTTRWRSAASRWASAWARTTSSPRASRPANGSSWRAFRRSAPAPR